MKIFVNSNFEIKALHSSDNPDLQEFEVDRIQVFGNKPDIVILGYCYKEERDQVSVYPYVDCNYLDLLEKQYEAAQKEREGLEQEVTFLQLAMIDLYEGMGI